MKTCVQCKHYQLPDFCKNKCRDIHSVWHICEHFTEDEHCVVAIKSMVKEMLSQQGNEIYPADYGGEI